MNWYLFSWVIHVRERLKANSVDLCLCWVHIKNEKEARLLETEICSNEKKRALGDSVGWESSQVQKGHQLLSCERSFTGISRICCKAFSKPLIINLCKQNGKCDLEENTPKRSKNWKPRLVNVSVSFWIEILALSSSKILPLVAFLNMLRFIQSWRDSWYSKSRSVRKKIFTG